LDLYVEWSEGLGRAGSREVQPDGLGAAGADWSGRRDDRFQRAARDRYRARQRIGAELYRHLDTTDDIGQAVPVRGVQTYLQADRLIIGKTGVHGELS